MDKVESCPSIVVFTLGSLMPNIRVLASIVVLTLGIAMVAHAQSPTRSPAPPEANAPKAEKKSRTQKIAEEDAKRRKPSIDAKATLKMLCGGSTEPACAAQSDLTNDEAWLIVD